MTFGADMLRKVCKSVNPKLVAAVLLIWSCLLVFTFLKNSHTEYPILPAPLERTTLQRVREYIHAMNTKQTILNQNSEQGTDLVIVIAVHDHHKSQLEELIQSLSLASGINNTLLIFSHESYDPASTKTVQAISFAKTMQIFYPLSIQTHPGRFPGPSPSDFRGQVWRNATAVQKKHHWWWTANFVFNRLRFLAHYKRFVLFLEDDHFVTGDFVHCFYLMHDYMMENCGTCWFAALALEIEYDQIPELAYEGVIVRKGVRSLGLVFNRTIWNEIYQRGEFYCKYNDPQWVSSLGHLINLVAVDYEISTLTMLSPRVVSSTKCNTYCRSKRKFPEFPPFLEELRMFLKVPYLNQKTSGGWGDSRDHALCMGM